MEEQYFIIAFSEKNRSKISVELNTFVHESIAHTIVTSPFYCYACTIIIINIL